MKLGITDIIECLELELKKATASADVYWDEETAGMAGVLTLEMHDSRRNLKKLMGLIHEKVREAVE